MILSLLLRTAEASIAPEYFDTPLMNELMSLQPKCYNDPSEWDLNPDLTIRLHVDNAIYGMYVDGVKIDFPQCGFTGNPCVKTINLTNHENYFQNCHDKVCDHVLAVKAWNFANSPSSFAAVVELGTRTWSTGYGAWRGNRGNPNDEVGNTWTSVNYAIEKQWMPDQELSVHRIMPWSAALTRGQYNATYINLAGHANGPRYYRFKFQTMRCPPVDQSCKDECLARDYSNMKGWPNDDGTGQCYAYTDMRCGISSKVCTDENGVVPNESCSESCSNCEEFWDRWWPDIWEKYYGSGGRKENLPRDWEGCFKWGVVWPCRGPQCKSPNNPDVPAPAGGSDASPCIPYSTPTCIEGWTPCGGGLPKCYEESATNDEKTAACSPMERPVCSKSGGSYGTIGGTGPGNKGKGNSGGGNNGGNNSGHNGGSEGGDGASPDPTFFPDPLDPPERERVEREREERERKEAEREKEKKERRERKREVKEPEKLLEQFCPTCASAEFKCREAQCDEWDCLWWCRCYEEGVEYECDEDGEPCDCFAENIQGQLYNVTYDELLNSGYMDVSFTGPGSEELMAKAKAATADMPLH